MQVLINTFVYDVTAPLQRF